MKISSESYTFPLNAESVDKCSDIVRTFLKKFKKRNSEITRYVLTVEEILLDNIDNATAEEFTLKTGTRFSRPYVTVEINGKPYNVFLKTQNERGALETGLLQNLGLSPDYVYAGTVNTYNFKVTKKQMNPFLSLIIALTAAIAVGIIGFLLPDAFREIALNMVFVPIHDTFLNILGCIAGPMVFLSVAWGIYGIGDAATLKHIGKKMLLGYIVIVFMVVAILGSAMLPFFSLSFSGGNSGASEVSSIFKMILDIFPENIFSPFVTGNTLQIIFLAVVIGIAMLLLGRKTTSVARAVEQINLIVQLLIEFVSRLVPYFIFIVVVSMLWGGTFGEIASVIKFFIIFFAAAIVMCILVIGYTAAVQRVNPFLLIRKGLPTLLIAITTASSAATFGTNISACRNKFGISDTVTSFGIPLGMVTFKPTTALSYVTMTYFFAEVYGIDISLSWIVLMMFTAGILSLATQPIPGGALASYTILFSQLGIPAEALAVALACDTLVDFISTGGDQFLLQYAVLDRASRLGMVDKTVLKSR